MNGHSQEYLDWMERTDDAFAEAIRRAVAEEYRQWLSDPQAQKEYQEWVDKQ